ncbi:hypothetical protein O7635_37535 [Asanoa sp. WMMD1127]|uniref:hypothetical protein n=1 Tax=Asanoa sp. WMMD1127 TaxID=3016107 RepID=UPI002417F42C|nr:hypothetical protein [Asanoa sp. WMMD1127]MDG4827579.1 hypothetical protein [Asanoa sp. WMMD1127]
MAVSDFGGQVSHLVREKVRSWCYGGNNYRRDAAALVYASGLQQRVLAWSMADLRRIATDPLQRGHYSVAEAVNQLYQPDRAGWLLTELTEWTRSADTRLHAARALVTLAHKPSATSAYGRPELLVRLAGAEADAAQLARLWRIALVEPALSTNAWSAFASWLWHADRDERLRPPAVDLLNQLAASPRMRRRLAFFLTSSRVSDDRLPWWVREVVDAS